MSAVVVTGMHRSGTSAIARLVQGLGLDVGSNLLGAGLGNVHGHFEEQAFIRFHDKLIDRLYPVRAPFCEWLPLAHAPISYTDADRAEAQTIWAAHQIAGGNAWKDPRTSLFLDLWTELLPDLKVIICLRHPYQVHQSLLRRGEPFLHADYSAAINGWTIYNERIVQVLAALPREKYIVVEVGTAFREQRRLAEELGKFLGRPIPEKAFEAISPEEFHFEDAYRGALEHFEEYLPEAGALFRQLQALDLLNPVAAPAEPKAAKSKTVPIQSAEARFIEFEERHGLRQNAREMLVKSISVDRDRTTELYQKLVQLDAEKDGLIDDLTKFNDTLKQKVMELLSAQQRQQLQQ